MPYWLTSLVLGCVPLLAMIILRIILDLRIAPWLVKRLSCIPVRTWFRDAPPDISGNWEQIWNSTSAGFAEDTERHSSATMYQFGRYCYAEFTAKGTRYCLFGRIRENFLFGEWYPTKQQIGYFGAFKLHILADGKMSGLWLGHSQTTVAVNSDQWKWKRTQ